MVEKMRMLSALRAEKVQVMTDVSEEYCPEESRRQDRWTRREAAAEVEERMRERQGI